MIVYPSPMSPPQELEFPQFGTRETIIPMIVIENGSKTYGSYSWNQQILTLEDHRVFRLDMVTGNYQLIHSGKN